MTLIYTYIHGKIFMHCHIFKHGINIAFLGGAPKLLGPMLKSGFASDTLFVNFHIHEFFTLKQVHFTCQWQGRKKVFKGLNCYLGWC